MSHLCGNSQRESIEIFFKTVKKLTPNLPYYSRFMVGFRNMGCVMQEIASKERTTEAAAFCTLSTAIKLLLKKYIF